MCSYVIKYKKIQGCIFYIATVAMKKFLHSNSLVSTDISMKP